MPILFAFLRNKVFIIVVIFFLAFANLAYISYLKQENSRLKADLSRISESLYSCQQANLELTKELKIQTKKYQAKVAELLRLANKPPKIIRIPQVIERKVYVTPRECRQMAQMIDEFIQLQKANGEAK